MTTTATGSIRFGGSGFGPDYLGRIKRKNPGEKSEDDVTSSPRSAVLLQPHEEEVEMFLFTVKEPIRSALSRLMLLIKKVLDAHPEEAPIEIPKIPPGPLGYTSLFAVAPVLHRPTKSIFRSVVR